METKAMDMPSAPDVDITFPGASSPEALGGSPDTRRLLLISRKGRVDPSLMEYSLGIAERMGLDLCCAYINSSPGLRGSIGQRRFRDIAGENAAFFRIRAKERGVRTEVLITNGKLVETVSGIVRTIRRVGLVLVEPGIAVDELTDHVSVPVLSTVITTGTDTGNPSDQSIEVTIRRLDRGAGTKRSTHQPTGGRKMAAIESREKTLRKTVVFGAAAAALYAGVFTFADPIMAMVSKGGFNALVPVATVFLFSYVHGNFTSSFWSLMGIEASKTAVVKPVTRTEKPTARKDKRPRARLNA